MVKLLSSPFRKKGRDSGLFCHKRVISTLLVLVRHANIIADTATCGTSEQAQALSLVIANDNGQKRKVLHCNPTLVQLAEI
ncbi:hypothetical protein, partial [Alteromonas marina]|uniref:hypothetical protein n=1 Tax=Alteromonas marina TaxID=203795 RepID=UPI00057EDE97